jgi:hypothetical protein
VADEAVGRTYLTISQGLADVANRWTVSHSWDHWQGEVVWMTLYFSVAVWCSIALILAPHAQPVLALARVPIEPSRDRKIQSRTF